MGNNATVECGNVGLRKTVSVVIIIDQYLDCIIHMQKRRIKPVGVFVRQSLKVLYNIVYSHSVWYSHIGIAHTHKEGNKLDGGK